MIRAELARRLKRFAEPLGAFAGALLCLWAALTTFGVTRWVMAVFALAALCFGLVALQRALFRARGVGTGLVEVDEGMLRYMSAFDGGEVEITAIDSLWLLPAQRGAAHWQVEGKEGSRLRIPVDAAGADQLFDVFAQLPGIETGRMLRQLRDAPDTPVVIWSSRRVTLH
ncbi:hypothetical protein AQS8620_00579 [Aquimixticola soesokkakensis]|uniref:Uncharacterized protein n=1 Tax=Aquimixticola soesokkakensis TaxID=1519096 RepID=A0A1Y5RMR0_9RHOB|nr:hypothetical protein [Aquimixticola soesokkakensis]SLN21103.1 hypothetical protein AQS8620_00579 [Aquimixticola soesokkakensis]